MESVTTEGDAPRCRPPRPAARRWLVVTGGRGGSEPILDRRSLNRALLARQGLLGRWSIPVSEAIERMVGLQSQAPMPPYYGLWTRLERFRPEQLSGLIEERRVVRAPLMRGTVHLVTAEDCLALRPVVQPVLARGFAAGPWAGGVAGVEMAALLAAGRELLAKEPLSGAALARAIGDRWSGHDGVALAHAVRSLDPLMQILPRGFWGGSRQAIWTTVETWLGRPLAAATAADDLVLRYLAEFGPATTADAEVWSGLCGLREVLARLRPRLVTFRDEAGRELFDLPDAPRPAAETPAPVRFLPEWDNVLLSHADRRRVIDEEHRRRIWTVNGLVPGTLLVDGFVAGTWRLALTKEAALLTVEPFAAVPDAVRRAVAEEGERLLAFAAPGLSRGLVVGEAS